jgi:hypothetical protein
MLFCQDMREKVKSDNPDMKVTQITSELGKLWKEADDVGGLSLLKAF